MKCSNLVLIALAAAGIAVSLAEPAAAQSEGRYWRDGISPYAEGPSGRPWNEEKLGPPPRGSYEYRRHRPRGFFTYRPPLYYEPPRIIYRGRHAAWTPEWYAYCARKYRSFNPRTGYFLGYDGRYHFCR